MSSTWRRVTRGLSTATLALIPLVLLWCGRDTDSADRRASADSAGSGVGAAGGARDAGTKDAASVGARDSPSEGDTADDVGGTPEAGVSLPCVPQPDASWVPGDADTIAVEPTPADAGDSGCHRDPYLPDHFEPPCVQPRPKPNCKDGWCTIEPGCFIMGAPWCEWGRARDTTNPVQVTLTHPFRLRQTELTQGQWKAQGLPNPSKLLPDGTGDCKDDACPLGNVTWPEVLAFANLLSKRDGLPECYELEDCAGELGAGLVCEAARSTYSSVYDCPGYRLPTGAEWEYAARAGTKTSVYSGEVLERAEMFVCVDDPVLSPIAWYCANAGPYTHPVCQKLPNDWGLYDTIGNAAEWVASIEVTGYGKGPYTDWGSELDASGLLDAGSPAMQLRGGTWSEWPNAERVSGLLVGGPSHTFPAWGFRLAQTLFRDEDSGD